MMCLFLCVSEAHSFRGLYKTNFVAYKAFCTYLQISLPSPAQKLQVLFVFNMLSSSKMVFLTTNRAERCLTAVFWQCGSLYISEYIISFVSWIYSPSSLNNILEQLIKWIWLSSWCESHFNGQDLTFLWIDDKFALKLLTEWDLKAIRRLHSSIEKSRFF